MSCPEHGTGLLSGSVNMLLGVLTRFQNIGLGAVLKTSTQGIAKSLGHTRNDH